MVWGYSEVHSGWKTILKVSLHTFLKALLTKKATICMIPKIMIRIQYRNSKLKYETF